GSHGDRDRDLGAHQPRQSRGQYPADPPPRDADPEKARRSPRRDGGAAAAVASSNFVGWAKAHRAVPTIFLDRGLKWWARFALPTLQILRYYLTPRCAVRR